MSKKYAAYPGRWSPFHKGHEYIIRKALDEGKPVLIWVRDTPLSESDPYTVEERIEMISKVFEGEDVVVEGIRDIESVNIGRRVGYGVNRYDSPEDIEGISATQIRKMMSEGNEEWKTFVPEAIAEYLEKDK